MAGKISASCESSGPDCQKGLEGNLNQSQICIFLINFQSIKFLNELQLSFMSQFKVRADSSDFIFLISLVNVEA